MSFALTVPGTDDRLEQQGDQLVHGKDRFAKLDHGIWDLTPTATRERLDRFATDYAAVRSAEGREASPAEVRALPETAPDHPLASMWTQRRASYEQFRKRVGRGQARTIVDIGAGCGWLAARMAANGWHAAALDVTVDGGDGLAAARHHNADLLLVRGDMGALPFADASVDLAVFNASLHYASDIAGALAEASRIAGTTGRVVVLDSPVFHDAMAGRAMVEEFAASVRNDHGVDAADHLGPGFVTWDQLAAHGFDRIDASGSITDRFHRWRGARRAGRETAQRPLLITRSTPSDRPDQPAGAIA